MFQILWIDFQVKRFTSLTWFPLSSKWILSLTHRFCKLQWAKQSSGVFFAIPRSWANKEEVSFPQGDPDGPNGFWYHPPVGVSIYSPLAAKGCPLTGSAMFWSMFVVFEGAELGGLPNTHSFFTFGTNAPIFR